MLTRAGQFSDAERRAVYRAIYERRDVRARFLADPIPDEVLSRVLDAAHHAPSVGFMQPWRFILVREARAAVRALFLEANAEAEQRFEGNRRALYRSLKLEAIVEAPLNVCVVCDGSTERGFGLGRSTMPETALYSTVCAVQNLWLAARAEGLGVGWVSILDPDALRKLLAVPEHATIVAYLCLGFVEGFDERPQLETSGWEQRAPLRDLIYSERYGVET